jgi:hypothetical protein
MLISGGDDICGAVELFSLAFRGVFVLAAPPARRAPLAGYRMPDFMMMRGREELLHMH